MQGLSGSGRSSAARAASRPKADEALAAHRRAVRRLKNDRELFDAGRRDSTSSSRPPAQPTAPSGPHSGPARRRPPRSTIPKSASRWFRKSSTSSKRRSCSPADLLFELADNLEGVSKGGKLERAASLPPGRARRRYPAAPQRHDGRRKERHRVRLLCRPSRRRRSANSTCAP